MMRIAIAGGGGLAYILAGEITQTANAVLVLSTRVSRQSKQSTTTTSSHHINPSQINPARPSTDYHARSFSLSRALSENSMLTRDPHSNTQSSSPWGHRWQL